MAVAVGADECANSAEGGIMRENALRMAEEMAARKRRAVTPGAKELYRLSTSFPVIKQLKSFVNEVLSTLA